MKKDDIVGWTLKDCTLYHREKCDDLNEHKFTVTAREIKDGFLRPCPKCRPQTLPEKLEPEDDSSREEWGDIKFDDSPPAPENQAPDNAPDDADSGDFKLDDKEPAPAGDLPEKPSDDNAGPSDADIPQPRPPRHRSRIRDKENLLQMAMNSLRHGKLDRALKEYQEALAADPKDYRLLMRLGEIHLKRKEQDKAVECYSQAAHYFFQDGFYSKAAALYKQALSIDAGRLDLAKAVADCYLQMGLYAEAMAQLRSIAARQEQDGKFEPALETIRSLTEIAPHDPDLAASLAELYYKLGRREEGDQAFQCALERFREEGHDEEAARLRERIVAICPDLAENAKPPARLDDSPGPTGKDAAGDPKIAAAADQEARAEEVRCYIIEAEVYLKYQLRDLARSRLRQALELEPDNEKALKLMAELTELGPRTDQDKEAVPAPPAAAVPNAGPPAAAKAPEPPSIVPPDLNTILKIALKAGASHIYLKVRLHPIYRIAGKLYPDHRVPRLTPEGVSNMAFGMMNLAEREKYKTAGRIDLAYGVPGLGRFQAAVFEERGYIGMILQDLPFLPPRFDQLEPPAAIVSLADRREGLIVVCGPAGGGREETAAAILDHINSTRTAHIATLEQGPGYLHRHRRSIFSEVNVGPDSASLSRAVRQWSLRDTDVLYVAGSEPRQEFESVLAAAAAGKLVVYSLDAVSVQTALTGLALHFPDYQRQAINCFLASVLRGAIYQRFLPPRQSRTRVRAYEVLLNTPAVSQAIAEGRYDQLGRLIREGARHGMIEFDACLHELLARMQAISLDTYQANLRDRGRANRFLANPPPSYEP